MGIGKLNMFKCACCGCCCRNILLSSIYFKLDCGDGICKYFDEQTSLCSIYEERPIECNIDAMYVKFFKDKMTKGKYYELNYSGCKALKGQQFSKK